MSIRSIISRFFNFSKKEEVTTPVVKTQTPSELALDLINDKLASLKDASTERRFIAFPDVCKHVDVVRLCIREGYYPRWIIQEKDGQFHFYERLNLKSGTRVAYPARPWVFANKGELVKYVQERYNGEYIRF